MFKKHKYEINDILSKVDLCENYIAICGNNTGSDWAGIKTATQLLFPKNHIVLPQYYSNQIVKDKDLIKILKKIKKIGINKLILNGLAPYFIKIIDFAQEANLDVFFIHHGGLAELSYNADVGLNNALELHEEKKIKKIGFVKKGLASSMEKIFKKEFFNINYFVPHLEPSQKFKDNFIHIGVLANDTYNKNRHTQVVAALAIPKSKVHVLRPNEFDYLASGDRIVEHKYLSKNDFLKLIGKMDVNLHCSYSESWGQIASESLAKGVPCIVPNNSGVFDSSQELKNKMVVKEYDNPNQISLKATELINYKFDANKFVELNNLNASKLLSLFLD